MEKPSTAETPPTRPNSRLKLYAAIAKVQAEMPRLVKNSEANTGKFGYKYITLDAIWDAIRPLLAKHGLISINRMEDGRLKSVLIHVESGEEESCSFPINVNQPPQQLGSAYTYARRYALCALLQIVADKDDDATAAMASPASCKPPAF